MKNGNLQGEIEQSANWIEEKRMTARQSQLLSQLEVEVSIELGTVSISAATLIDWVVGERVSLSLHREDSVMLLVGGEKVARAHIVGEGGEVFLEVAEIYEETTPSN